MEFRNALLLSVIASVALSGCYIEEVQGSRKPGNPADPSDPPTAVNRAPTITGSPPPIVIEGELYDFTPSAADTDGDTLNFAIARKPAWATFNRATGRLSGTPSSADVGNFTNIEISVSDGQESVNLTAFDITVDAIALGAATLSWNPPTENMNGSALTDLAGYKIYYGRSADQLSRMIVIDNPGLTRYVVENLAQSRWHFSMTSFNSKGVESQRTTTISKLIS